MLPKTFQNQIKSNLLATNQGTV